MMNSREHKMRQAGVLFICSLGNTCVPARIFKYYTALVLAVFLVEATFLKSSQNI